MQIVANQESQGKTGSARFRVETRPVISFASLGKHWLLLAKQGVLWNVRLLPALAFISPANVPADSVREFQSFMESPPPIAELVFEQRQGDGTTWGLVRWQTNACLIRRAKNGSDLHGKYNPELDIEITGRLDNHYWRISHDTTVGNKLMEWVDLGSSTERTNRVAVAWKANVKAVEHALSLGVPLAGPGTIRWGGLSFSYNAESGTTIRGIIEADASGRVAEMELIFVTENPPRGVPKEMRGRIAYRYDNPALPAWMPSQLIRDIIEPKTGKRSVVNTLTIHKLAVGPVPPDEFRVSRYLSNSVFTITVTNGKAFYQGATGSGELLSADDPRTKLVERRARFRAAYFSAAMMFLLVAAAVVVRAAMGRTRGQKGQNN